MSLKDKILNKLQPHAERIVEGVNDEFDYLPGVLVHLLQEQEKHSVDNVKHMAALSKNLNQTAETANIQLIQNLTQLKADNQNMMATIQQENQVGLQAITKHVSQSTEAINNSITQLKLSIESETKKIRLVLIANLIFSGLAVGVVIYLATK
jgi:cell division septum initiation protein DivIVA